MYTHGETGALSAHVYRNVNGSHTYIVIGDAFMRNYGCSGIIENRSVIETRRRV